MDRRKNPHSLAAIGLGWERAVFKNVGCSYSLYREAVGDADGGEKQRGGEGMGLWSWLVLTGTPTQR